MKFRNIFETDGTCRELGIVPCALESKVWSGLLLHITPRAPCLRCRWKQKESSSPGKGWVLEVAYDITMWSRLSFKRKQATKDSFGVQAPSSGLGVFHMKGWGLKKLVCPSNPGKICLWLDIWENRWDIPEIQGPKVRTKRSMFTFWPAGMATI